MRLFASEVPPLALAFETFLCNKGQSQVAEQLPIDLGYLFPPMLSVAGNNKSAKSIKVVD